MQNCDIHGRSLLCLDVHVHNNWNMSMCLNYQVVYNMSCTCHEYHMKPGPEVIKLFPCSTQLSMKFFLLINVKMPTIVGISTFMSRKNSILGLFEPKNSRIS